MVAEVEQLVRPTPPGEEPHMEIELGVASKDEGLRNLSVKLQDDKGPGGDEAW